MDASTLSSHPASPAAPTPPAGAAPPFRPVELASLDADVPCPFDLYHSPNGRRYELLRPKGTPLTRDDCARLVLEGVRVLFIDAAQDAEHGRYLKDLLDRLLYHTDRPVQSRCALILGCGLQMARQLLRDPYDQAAYRRAHKVVEAMVMTAHQDPAAAEFLLAGLRHDEYICTHLANVSTMAVLLAARMGSGDLNQLIRIGFGGLLHDVGKSRVPRDLLERCEPLTEDQLIPLRRHADLGLQIVHKVELMTQEAACMVHQHHERLDGTGYPIGLTAQELPWASRLCAVVDVFDAMTCKRPYRNALHVSFVLEYLFQQATRRRMDRDAVTAWIEMVRWMLRTGAGPAGAAATLGVGAPWQKGPA